MSNFWDFVWLLFTSFILVAYLIILFQIIVDLFRDVNLSGFSKAIWFIGLIFLPFFTVLAYVIFRGNSMAERQTAYLKNAKQETDNYIRTVAGYSPTEEINKAKTLLDNGTISSEEFNQLKQKLILGS